MKFQTKLKLTAALLTGLVAITSAQADTKTVNASVTVNNTITVAVNSHLNFGTIAAFANSNTTPELATLTISPDPAVAPIVVAGATGTAKIIPLIAGTPADVSVSGAAPNTLLSVNIAAADSTLTDPAGNAVDGFTMANFLRYAYTEGNGQTFGSTTDATGTLAFYVGATLSTVTPGGGAAGADAAVAYTDATYTGAFEVTVNY